MIVIGLTGSIAMGKTTAAGILRRMGLPVHDADAAVHRLFRKGGAAVAAVGQAFPGMVCDGAVDRDALGRQVFGEPEALLRLEAIVHPMVRADSDEFLRHCARRRAPMAVLDIPLLFEAGRDRDCDAIILVSAPAFLQAQRVLRRRGMTMRRLAEIRARQMPDREKRRRADFVVRTGLSRRETLRQLAGIVKLLRSGYQRRGRNAPRVKRRNPYA
ncbi:MAG: dephospho-CoA kinase [Alphaproteobacteria bacterium]|nr:dephospho-CoA kinase [Alphaproteobacteria bacterium]